MSAVTSSSPRIRLRQVCCVRFATYRHEADVLAELARWRREVEAALHEGAPPSEYALIEKFHDVTLVLHQADLAGEPTPEEVARACRDACLRRPVPDHGRLGLTTVVQARGRMGEGVAPCTLESAADDLLTVLTARERGSLRGGVLSPGVELWAVADDLAWLVMLCDDTDAAEHAADWLLTGPLWKHEAAVHKAGHQFGQFRRLRRRLRRERDTLHQAIDALSTALDPAPSSGTAPDPDTALDQNRRTTAARRLLNETVGRARRMRTSLKAHRANLQAMRLLLGAGPGLAALELRRQNLDQMIAQVHLDTEYAQPALESAHDVCALHRAHLTNVLNQTEKEENRLRERSNALVALLGLWIGLMQVVSSIWLSDRTSGLWTTLMALWAIIGVLGVVASRTWPHSPRPSPPRPALPPR